MAPPKSVKDGITFFKSSRPLKKYKAVFGDGTVIHFGYSAYQHVRDSTGLGAWSHKDHGDLKRRANFRARHNCRAKPKKSAGYLSCQYLW